MWQQRLTVWWSHPSTTYDDNDQQDIDCDIAILIEIYTVIINNKNWIIYGGNNDFA